MARGGDGAGARVSGGAAGAIRTRRAGSAAASDGGLLSRFLPAEAGRAGGGGLRSGREAAHGICVPKWGANTGAIWRKILFCALLLGVRRLQQSLSRLLYRRPVGVL